MWYRDWRDGVNYLTLPPLVKVCNYIEILKTMEGTEEEKWWECVNGVMKKDKIIQCWILSDFTQMLEKEEYSNGQNTLS